MLSDRSITLVIRIALTVAFLCVAACLALSIIAYSKNLYNEERLAPSFAWSIGLTVYRTHADGPLLSVLYGPVFYLLYWPATLFRHAAASLTFGTLWSMFFYCLPVLFLIFQDRHAPTLARLLPPLAFFTVTLASYWGAETEIMLAIHPDAAACGFAGLGLAIALMRPLTFPRIAASIPLCMLAIACKQNAALTFLLLLALIWWRGGGRWLGRALLVSAVTAILILAALSYAYGGLGGIWFNNYLIPKGSGLLWDKWSGASLVLYQSFVMPLILLAVIASNEVTAGRTGNWKRQVIGFSILFVVVPFVLCVPAYLFPGGAGNAFAPSIYAMVALPALWLRNLLLNSPDKERPVRAVGPAALLCLIAIAALSLAVRRDQLKETLRTSAASVVEGYCARHPGEVYFPFNPVAVYRGEGRIYHTDWGLTNPSRAGYLTSPAEFSAAMPRSARYIAYPVADGYGANYLLKRFWPGAQRVQLPELPDFYIYEITPLKVDSP
jgi:hypothetical protein